LTNNYWYENQLLMHTKRCKSCTPLHLYIAYLSGFKRGGIGLGRRVGEVYNLICRSLFHYYGDYSTSTFLLSMCFLPFVYFLPSIYFLPYTSFPLYASSIYFLSMLPSKRGGGRENRSVEGGGVRELLAPPFIRVFKTDFIPSSNKILLWQGQDENSRSKKLVLTEV
jgi:hypothetical protein